jgi:hypothetical protein
MEGFSMMSKDILDNAISTLDILDDAINALRESNREMRQLARRRFILVFILLIFLCILIFRGLSQVG